ncbi:MAG: ThuA domain-containing protein [Reichenbachiella sp.]
MKLKLTLTMVLIAMVSFVTMAQQFKALLFTKTVGWHHASIHEGVKGMRWLAERHDFALEWSENAGLYFNDEKLAQFDVIIFLNTTGDILNEEQQGAFERFIQSGKGYVGIHAASDTEYDWPWYNQLVGRMFVIHPTNQTALIKVEDRNFPGLELMPDQRWWTDEWYEFTEEKTDNLNYLLTVDESTYDFNAQWGDKKAKGMNGFHPIAWYHDHDGGRAFYTALGHIPGTYSDAIFLEHIYGGIMYSALGKGINSNPDDNKKKKKK